MRTEHRNKVRVDELICEKMDLIVTAKIVCIPSYILQIKSNEDKSKLFSTISVVDSQHIRCAFINQQNELLGVQCFLKFNF